MGRSDSPLGKPECFTPFQKLVNNISLEISDLKLDSVSKVIFKAHVNVMRRPLNGLAEMFIEFNFNNGVYFFLNK